MYKKLLLTISSVFLIQISCVNASNLNKESFSAVKELFSKDADIDYKGLYGHLHYTFKNPNLLRDALHPMLPPALNASKQQFDRLELLGDSVMETIIIEKLLNIFPNEMRGHINQIRSNLVKNQTLSDVFYQNMDIERYLPYPGDVPYEVCNVMEALIGAIKQDDKANGHLYAEQFVKLFMDSELFMEKIRTYAMGRGIQLAPQITDAQREALNRICTPEAIAQSNPKNLIGEVLQTIFHTEIPQYLTHFDIDGNDQLIFKSQIIASDIGHKIIGSGYTIQESDENAARMAINYLSPNNPLYLSTEPRPFVKNFRAQLNELKNLLKVKPQSIFSAIAPFSCEIKLGEQVIGQGNGALSKAQAEEEAAKHAIKFLVDRANAEEQKRYNIKLAELQVKHAKRLEKTFQGQNKQMEEAFDRELNDLRTLRPQALAIAPVLPKKSPTKPVKLETKETPEPKSLKKSQKVKTPSVPVEALNNPAVPKVPVAVAPSVNTKTPVNAKAANVAVLSKATTPKTVPKEVVKPKKKPPANKKPPAPKG